jgi:hypothetical protein
MLNTKKRKEKNGNDQSDHHPGESYPEESGGEEGHEAGHEAGREESRKGA